MTAYSPAILSSGGEVGKLGDVGSRGQIGSALCPFLGGRTGRPASHRASLRLAVTPVEGPGHHEGVYRLGPESRPPHQVPGPRVEVRVYPSPQL